jgi:hypothetical protein
MSKSKSKMPEDTLENGFRSFLFTAAVSSWSKEQLHVLRMAYYHGAVQVFLALEQPDGGLLRRQARELEAWHTKHLQQLNREDPELSETVTRCFERFKAHCVDCLLCRNVLNGFWGETPQPWPLCPVGRAMLEEAKVIKPL